MSKRGDNLEIKWAGSMLNTHENIWLCVLELISNKLIPWYLWSSMWISTAPDFHCFRPIFVDEESGFDF